MATVYSLVIKVDEGEIDEIEWDNDCDLCDDECLEMADQEVCAEEFCSDPTECDPRFYVS